MLTQSHFPPTIVAQNGTAGKEELKVWIGHEFGGHLYGEEGMAPESAEQHQKQRESKEEKETGVGGGGAGLTGSCPG